MPAKKSDNLIIVDTSIWIEYFRNRKAPLVEKLESLIYQRQIRNIPLITAELIRGCLHLKEVHHIQTTIKPIPCCPMEESTWEKVALFAFGLARKGLSVSLVDAVIAHITIEAGHVLWTKDKDFQRIATHSTLELFD